MAVFLLLIPGVWGACVSPPLNVLKNGNSTDLPFPDALQGKADPAATPCWKLTPNNESSAGQIWNQEQLLLSFDFTAKAWLNWGWKQAGADGLAFVVQPLSADQGSEGGGQGYRGIKPSLAVEFDTFDNTEQGQFDPYPDHVGLMMNGDTNHSSENCLPIFPSYDCSAWDSSGVGLPNEGNPGPECEPNGRYILLPPFGGRPAFRANPNSNINQIYNVEDDTWYAVEIHWSSATQELTLQWGTDRNSLQEVFKHTRDIIANPFNGNPLAYWGFTAGTGSLYNEHRVCIENFQFCPQGTIWGHTYIDSNGDGTQQAGEPNLPNVGFNIRENGAATTRPALHVVTPRVGSVPPQVVGDWFLRIQPDAFEATIDYNTVTYQGVPFGPSLIQTEGSTTTPTYVDTVDSLGNLFLGNIGFYPIGEVCGTVFHDQNGDGSKVGDGPLPGGPVTVTITSTNAAGQVVKTTITQTDAAGSWCANVPGSTDVSHSAHPTVPPGYASTTNNDPTPPKPTTPGQTTPLGDQGYKQPTLEGKIFRDWNGNGNRDPEDNGIPNVQVVVSFDQGSPPKTVTTDILGDYTTNPPPEATTVTVNVVESTLPPSYALTTSNEPWTGPVPSNKDVTVPDIGYRPPDGSLTGKIFRDWNGDGVLNGNDDGIPNVRVVVTFTPGGVVATVITNPNGDYSASVPPAATSVTADVVESTLPQGYTLTTNNEPRTEQVPLAGDVHVQDIGYRPPDGSLTGKIFRDWNGDGILNNNDDGIANVQVVLTFNNQGGSRTVTTNADGDYQAPVPPVASSVTADVVENTLPAGYTLTTNNEPRTESIPDSKVVDVQDIGYRPPDGELKGKIFRDWNGDGIRNNNDDGIPNVQVVVTFNNNAGVWTVTTNANGDYATPVPPAATSVTADVVENSLPQGYTETTNNEPRTESIPNNRVVNVQDIGYRPPDGSLTGKIFRDVEGDGILNNNDDGIPNVQVVVTFDQGGSWTVTTNPNGDYTAPVPPVASSVTVDVVEASLPAGYTLTTSNEPWTGPVSNGDVNVNDIGYQPTRVCSSSSDSSSNTGSGCGTGTDGGDSHDDHDDHDGGSSGTHHDSHDHHDDHDGTTGDHHDSHDHHDDHDGTSSTGTGSSSAGSSGTEGTTGDHHDSHDHHDDHDGTSSTGTGSSSTGSSGTEGTTGTHHDSHDHHDDHDGTTGTHHDSHDSHDHHDDHDTHHHGGKASGTGEGTHDSHDSHDSHDGPTSTSNFTTSTSDNPDCSNETSSADGSSGTTSSDDSGSGSGKSHKGKHKHKTHGKHTRGSKGGHSHAASKKLTGSSGSKKGSKKSSKGHGKTPIIVGCAGAVVGLLMLAVRYRMRKVGVPPQDEASVAVPFPVRRVQV